MKLSLQQTSANLKEFGFVYFLKSPLVHRLCMRRVHSRSSSFKSGKNLVGPPASTLRPCPALPNHSKMEFLGARYHLRRKSTKSNLQTYSCKWYAPSIRQSPITGYRLFRTQVRTRFFNAAPQLATSTILGRIRKEWKRLPADRRDHYRRLELSKQPSSRRCAGLLSFQTAPKVSNLIRYTAHSPWLVLKAKRLVLITI